VIQLVQAYGGYDVSSYIRALLGFAVVFNVGSVYYEQQQREPHKHVLARSRSLGFLWLELQSLLSLCVLFFAVGLKLVFHGFDEEKSFRDESLMCIFAAISLALMYLMAAMHRGIVYNLDWTSGRMSSLLFRLLVTLLCVLIPFISPSSTITVLMLHVLTTALVMQDVVMRVKRVSLLREWFGLTREENNQAWSRVMDASITSQLSFIGLDSTRSGVSIPGPSSSGPSLPSSSRSKGRKWWSEERMESPNWLLEREVSVADTVRDPNLLGGERERERGREREKGRERGTSRRNRPIGSVDSSDHSVQKATSPSPSPSPSHALIYSPTL